MSRSAADPAQETGTAALGALADWFHRTRHRALAASTAVAYRSFKALLDPSARGADAKTVRVLAERFEKLIDDDLRNVALGYYPRRVLDGFPLRSYLATLPFALAEMPKRIRKDIRPTTGGPFTGNPTGG